MPTDEELLSAPLKELLAAARAVRDRNFGPRVTYSPKVFIPLTKLCRDHCGYCVFARSPTKLEAPYLAPDEVLAIARAGARAGCHEALFTLGERPELRYEVAARWLTERGYASTVDYLAEMAKVVVEETGLLPHANAGALYEKELATLRCVTASQGMMLESLNPALLCHRGAPDKAPERRLGTLEAAGRLAVPFTTGILVGIGESRSDRLEALRAIAEHHERYGNVQEVIVQNFLPNKATLMASSPPCPAEEHLWAIAVARLVLPADVHLQAPPNLTDDFGALLDAGTDDWGGVSPVTADHVNPGRAWPSVERLREVTEARGHTLAPRLTVYPEFALSPERWLDASVRFAVLDRSDAEGLARDDPGALFPEKVAAARPAGNDVELTPVGERSTAWYSGALGAPPVLVPAQSRTTGPVAEVLEGVRLGQEPGVDELVTLFSARGPEVPAVAECADELRREAVGETVTWVHNRNINYTNICTFKCRFCGFSKGPLSLNLRGAPYLLSLEEIADRAREAARRGATEVTLQGGVHPSFDGNYYVEVCKAVAGAAPGVHLHGFSALELTEGARRLGEPLADYLNRLVEAGLGSIPGTAAEILDDEVRQQICPDKVTTDEWLFVHESAHLAGIRSNVTIMHGSVERPLHWARHLVRTRELQRRTGGFTEFVPLPFVHMATPLYLQRGSRRGPTFREVLLMHAVGRIAYRGLIGNVQASWVKVGADGVRQLLQAGVNDLGGTLMEDNISRAAGASHGQGREREDFEALVAPLGRPLRQRTTLYELLP
ncbi:MAG: 5-amino-6-(D-ribitylamino)uracil--L-tyrosine 4-hydroxyphenyl transferase CofH [Acidimicrobiales bacterium]